MSNIDQTAQADGDGNAVRSGGETSTRQSASEEVNVNSTAATLSKNVKRSQRDGATPFVKDNQRWETPAGETPAGETPAGKTPAGKTPAGETPAGETPAGETPAGETPAGETPAGETPAGETPAGETPAGETRTHPAGGNTSEFSLINEGVMETRNNPHGSISKQAQMGKLVGDDESASITERFLTTQNNPHDPKKDVEGLMHPEATQKLPPELSKSQDIVLSKQDQLLREIKEAGNKERAAAAAAVRQEVEDLKGEVKKEGLKQLEKIREQAALIENGKAPDQPMAALSSFLFLPTVLTENKEDDRGMMGSLQEWPPRITYKMLPRAEQLKPWCSLLIHKCPTPYVLEVHHDSGDVGHLKLTSDGHDRRDVGKSGEDYSHCCLNAEQTQAFCTLKNRPVVLICDLIHNRDVTLCVVQVLREIAIRGAKSTATISCFRLTGLLAVTDDRADTLTLTHPDESHRHTVNLTRAGVQLAGTIWGVTWGATERDLYVIDHSVGASDDRSSVIHLELYPPQVKWKVRITGPESLYYSGAFLYTRIYEQNARTYSTVLLSPQNGKILDRLPQTHGLEPIGFSRDSVGEKDVVIQYGSTASAAANSSSGSSKPPQVKPDDHPKKESSGQRPQLADHSGILGDGILGDTSTSIPAPAQGAD